MKSLFLICFLLLLNGLALSQIREYIPLRQAMSWTRAQNYCRQNYGDLASITTEEENQRAVKATGQNIFFWIGLNKPAPNVDIWKWSDGEPANFVPWYSGEVFDHLWSESCTLLTPIGWFAIDCRKDCPVLCQRKFTMVKENKTWNEALNHCRSNSSDLVFVDSEAQLGLLKTATAQAQTASVWTGLRFLNGKWYKVNGMPMGSLESLPPCPVHPYRCAAYNFKTYVWENRNCNEPLNFLCY